MTISRLRAGNAELRKFSPSAADDCDAIASMLEQINQRFDEREQRRSWIATLDSFGAGETMH